MTRDRDGAALPKAPSGSEKRDARFDYDRALVETVPVVLFEANGQNFQFTFVSDYAETLLGYPSRLWVEQPSFWKEHVYSEDLEWAEARRSRAIKESSEYDFEYRLVANDGGARWVRELGRVVPGEAGQRQVVGALIDLSKKRSAQETLSEEKPWLRQIIDTIPAQIWSGTADGKLDFFNLQCRTQSGLGLDALRGDGWQQVLHPDDRDHVLRAWRESVASGTPYEQQERLRIADGSYRWFLSRGVPLRDEGGNIVRVFGCNADIDDQKRAEEALRQSEQRWRAVFQNAWVGVALLDSSLRIVDANAADERMFGYTRSELRSMTCLDITSEDDRQEYKTLIQELIAGKRDHVSVEKRNRRKDGDLIWVRVNGSTINIGDSRLWIMITEDISESKRLHDNLARERDRLQLLLDLNRKFVSKLDLDELLDAVLDGLRKLAGWDGAMIVLPPDDDSISALVYKGGGSIPELQESPTTLWETSLPRQVLRSGQPIVFRTEDLPALSHPSMAWAKEIVRARDLKSGCMLPLRHDDKALGVLVLATRDEQDAVTGDLKFLQELASLVAPVLSNSLRFDEVSASQARLTSEKKCIEDQVRSEAGFDGIVGESTALKDVLQQVDTVAHTDATVLIMGETGTGKELVARAIHERSPRRDQSFIKVDCAAIPPTLIESELFGYEKGAFTGAIAQKLGRLETANRGTLFLDEVGDIPLELQSKLLRVLQDHAFERVGSNRTRHIDVRVIAATNRNLEAMVAAGKFREDLYYRLKVFPIVIPPLRDRPGDILPLVRHYVTKYARRMKKRIPVIPPEAMEIFSRYSWPGNVRELQHFMERAVILTPGHVLRAPLGEIGQAIQRMQPPAAKLTRARTMEEIERESILEALRESDWVVGGPHGAAAKLGLKRTTLASRIERFGISRRQ